jgi:hypothetical protein
VADHGDVDAVVEEDRLVEATFMRVIEDEDEDEEGTKTGAS